MKVVFTARRIRPGSFEQFRQAWEPDRWPDGMIKSYMLRDPSDPDVVVAFGMFDVTDQRAEELRSELVGPERERHARMAPHVAQVIVSGLFDVVLTETGTATGDRTVVPLTERRLHPGTLDRYTAAAQAAWEALGGAPPPGLARMLLMRDDADPDHVIQLGIVRADDPAATREASRPGRQVLLEAIEPFVASVGLDATYELVQELSPTHV
jgi:hypothetical protein